MKQIKKFYSDNPFPGQYSLNDLQKYDNGINNRYIKTIDRYLQNNIKVLDVGCGTGLLTNLFARKYTSTFLGIDFSDSADYANKFSEANYINNAIFLKKDFFDYDTECLDQFDVIIAQSFVTHVPDYKQAFDKIKKHLNPGGVLILGVYNNYGKILKKFFRLNYFNKRLQLDQEHNPFELSFTNKDILDEFGNYKLLEVMPSYHNKFVQLSALINSKNGGLTIYVFKNE